MSISISLVAVFIPVLFMGGILGRLFHEFAATLTLAIAISAAVSLTLTPMLCGRFMRRDRAASATRRWRRLDGAVERGFRPCCGFYAATLGWALRWRWLMLVVTVATVVLTVWLYTVVPKGFFPDPGHRPDPGRHRRRAGDLLRRHGRAPARGGRRAAGATRRWRPSAPPSASPPAGAR